jgi:hypothetical protein
MSYKKKTLIDLLTHVFEEQDSGDLPTHFSSRELMALAARAVVDKFLASQNPHYEDNFNKVLSMLKTFPSERLVIVVTGETKTGKSYLGKEIANALAYARDRVQDSMVTLYDEQTSKPDWYEVVKKPETSIMVLSNHPCMRLQKMLETAHYVIECSRGYEFKLVKARDFHPEVFNKTLMFRKGTADEAPAKADMGIDCPQRAG